MKNRRTPTVRAAAGLGVLALVGVGSLTVATPAAAQPGAGAGTCSLATQPLIVTGAQPDARTEQFAAYGDTSGAWIGADSTYSVELKRGTTAWLFSDTVLGTVVDGTVDMATMGFINNSIVLEKGGQLHDTVTGGTEQEREAIFGPPAADSWFWLGAGYVEPSGRNLYIGLNRYNRSGPGLWDWAWDHSAIGTLNTRTWQVEKVTDLDVDNDVQWTSWYQRDHGVTYLYGVDDQGALKQAHVARVRGQDLSRVDRWEFWNGSTWTKDSSQSAPILDHVANEYSVTPFRDGYLLVTHDTEVVFSNQVVAYTACSPTGPFVNRTPLLQTPETGPWGSYGDPNIWTYNSHVHPQFSDDGRLLISYNVNTFDNNHIFDDVTIYRPRFWTVTVDDPDGRRNG